MEQGSDFHAAMAATWLHGAPGGWPAPIETAVARVFAQEGDALREQGIVCVECVLGGPADEAARHGRYAGTCDLVTDNGAGLTVTDYKTKASLQPAYVDAELRQTQRSWQFKQYAWFVQEQFGRPVTHVRKLLVAFKPTLRVWLQTYPVTQQELSVWYAQAQDVWNLMDSMTGEWHDAHGDDSGPLSVWQNADACERYGWQHRCDYYEHCWDGQPIEYAKESAQ